MKVEQEGRQRGAGGGVAPDALVVLGQRLLSRYKPWGCYTTGLLSLLFDLGLSELSQEAT